MRKFTLVDHAKVRWERIEAVANRIAATPEELADYAGAIEAGTAHGGVPCGNAASAWQDEQANEYVRWVEEETGFELEPLERLEVGAICYFRPLRTAREQVVD